jgi:ATP-binding cassette subfamily F protein uup
VGTLSGGQQNRLMLSKIMADPGNVLILDEPTNDLDMDTLDMLQEMLAEYKGTLLVVSHDRDFLDRTVTEVLAFEGEGKVEGFIGGYTDYHDAKIRLTSEAKKKITPLIIQETIEPQEKKNTNKMSFKFKHELEKLPGKITDLEKEIESLKQTLAASDLYTRDPAAFDSASRRFARAVQELADAESRWLELEEMKG